MSKINVGQKRLKIWTAVLFIYLQISLFPYNDFNGGTRWRSKLRHCATNRKVAGSFPGAVIGIFLRHNPSFHSMAQGPTQYLGYLLGVKAADV